MKRALVTGATGFIGSALTERLLHDGVDVVAHVRSTARVESLQGQGCRVVVTDLVSGPDHSPDALTAAVEGCDVVFHCAGDRGGQPERARAVNVAATEALARLANAAGVSRFVHLSSMAVHGYGLPPVLREEQPLLAAGAYGTTKRDGEQAVFGVADEGPIQAVVLRPTLVYGPGSADWVVDPIERLRQGRVHLVGRADGLANLVYIDDLVSAMVSAALTVDAVGEAFLISGPAPVSWRHYLRSLAQIAGVAPPPQIPAPTMARRVANKLLAKAGSARPSVDLPYSAEMNRHTLVSIAKARGILGYRPEVSVALGMERTRAWLERENQPSGGDGRRALT